MFITRENYSYWNAIGYSGIMHASVDVGMLSQGLLAHFPLAVVLIRQPTAAVH